MSPSGIQRTLECVGCNPICHWCNSPVVILQKGMAGLEGQGPHLSDAGFLRCWQSGWVLGVQGELPPMAVFGLLQHETKLSVVSFSVRKAAALEEPLPNKTELLLVTGLRCCISNTSVGCRLGR